ncbi:extracellular solute-binding protein [Sandaracinus amylolyticus]|uniref:Maltose/maltodextrin ABC transporter, permease protein MalF n=1 Tax=Sandaracinus amylolyticus TaxID=927083 RepID=A0A0F6YMU3_9BACT|nr:extracellular solute-binding protein [Sandaracinus amylolyticus]AKF11428.1 Maltose/maltodextrin ABC transporter, permease protein MalF [Sandaracinus amylolyticus]
MESREPVRFTVCLALLAVISCAPRERDDAVVLTFPVSAVGEERSILARQLRRFEDEHPGVRVATIEMPDDPDPRHQLYVQWLNAGVSEPDLLQIDVIWTAELASAGWILPLDRFAPDVRDTFPRVLEAGRHDGRLFAMPWFVDVGMLYWRTDLVDHAPASLDELTARARDARVDHGLVLSAARGEGLVTVFVEMLGAYGGEIVDARGEVVVDSDAAVRALEWMRDAIHVDRVIPEEALSFREEQARFAFQNGRALFMRNWPYAYRLMQASPIAGRFAVAPMPGTPDGAPTAALGGQLLAINARSEHPDEAFALIEFLSRPEQMLERLAIAGQLPPRPSLYDDPRFAEASPIPAHEAREVILRAALRPSTPVYGEISRALQIHLHRALTNQESPRAALSAAADEMRARLAHASRPPSAASSATWLGWLALVAAIVAVGWLAWRARALTREERVAWGLVLPALLVIALFAIVPLTLTFAESLHDHDLRAPWRGRPLVGLANYGELASTPRFWEALAHTVLFTTCCVVLEVLLGLALALVLDATRRWRGITRAMALLPWALPTVVAALVWRFLFEGDRSFASDALVALGLRDEPFAFLSHPSAAWIPLIAADVWKTTPFVALLLLAGLTSIDPALHEAARVDGAGPVRRFVHITLPLLRPALVVALLFRALDAFRVFDLAYVLTGGGPGTATEPLALYDFQTLFSDLRFGYGSAISIVIFACTAIFALVCVRVLGAEETRR